MRAMKDSGIAWIGEIPEDWKIVRNKNAFVCNKELVGKKSALTQLLSLTTRGIKKKDINNAEGKLPESFDTYQFVKENDIVMCLFDLDCSAVFSGISPIDGMISPAYRVLSCKECMEPRYADYWFRYISDGRKFNHFAKNIRYTLSYEEFSALPLLLPKKVEQHRIADYLDRKCSQIDAIIARQQEVIEKLNAYKLSVITEAVTKGLNPDVPMKDSGIPWLGNICNHYALSRVGAFCFVTKLAGFEYTDIMSSAISDTGEVPIVRAQNVRMFNFNDNIDEYIGLDVSQKLDRCTLNKKCLLITFIGAGIGDVCVFSKAMRYHLAPNVAKIEIRDEYKTILDEEYLMFYLGSLAGKGEISKISKASAQPSLSMGTIRGITIAVPPIDEQRKISEYLSRKIAFIDKVVRGKESIIENLLAYKNSLIYEIVTGKKEV